MLAHLPRLAHHGELALTCGGVRSRYRARRDHSEFLDKLKHHMATPADFWMALMVQLQSLFHVVDTPVEEALAVANAALPSIRKSNAWVTFHPRDAPIPGEGTAAVKVKRGSAVGGDYDVAFSPFDGTISSTFPQRYPMQSP